MATTEPVWAEPDQERVLAPAFLDGLREWPISELRARRRLAESAEQHLSFLRRMLQGRLDILTSEQRLRGTAGADARPATMPESDVVIVARLTEALTDHGRAAPRGLGRVVAVDGRDAGDESALADGLGDATLNLRQLTAAELDAMLVELGEQESSTSALRRQVQQVSDVMAAELGRRYRDHEADVEKTLGLDGVHDNLG